MQWLKDSIQALDKQIDDHIDRHTKLRENASLITSIPGLGTTTAATKIKESGSSVPGRSVMARSGHAAVRHALYMPAMVALKHHLLMKVFAERLKADGLVPKAVVAACLHKLIRQIYGVLNSRNASDATFLGYRLDIQDGI